MSKFLVSLPLLFVAIPGIVMPPLTPFVDETPTDVCEELDIRVGYDTKPAELNHVRQEFEQFMTRVQNCLDEPGTSR